MGCDLVGGEQAMGPSISADMAGSYKVIDAILICSHTCRFE